MTQHTKVGIATTRLPAGSARMSLYQLARRGSAACRRACEDTRGHRLLLLLCDSLAIALTDLSIAESRASQAERSLAAAQLRMAALERKVRELSFDEPTVTHPDPALAQALVNACAKR